MENLQYDEEKDEYICPNNRRLQYQGIPKENIFFLGKCLIRVGMERKIYRFKFRCYNIFEWSDVI